MPRALPEPTRAHLPRWCGANLLALYRPQSPGPFKAEEFAWLESWGMNFARLPMSWRTWSSPARWRAADPAVLGYIDDAIRLGERHGVHVQLNLHHAPGFCVHGNRLADEPWRLWTDADALEACAYHWGLFANRYRGIPNRQLTFNPINEPIDPGPEAHHRVMQRICEAIHREDPQRLVVCDGTRWGRDPAWELIDLPCAQSLHCYDPIHFVFSGLTRIVPQAATWGPPDWPMTVPDGDPPWSGRWDRQRLRTTWLEPWQVLQDRGVGLHVGEFGISNQVPHRLVLAYLSDCLSLWREAGWGWALWDLHGPLGLLDSQRPDVGYETWNGHQLDRAMLDLLIADAAAELER